MDFNPNSTASSGRRLVIIDRFGVVIIDDPTIADAILNRFVHNTH
jgi:hypothetical protein